VFNRRCARAGAAIGFDPDIRISHRNPTRLGRYLKHQYDHGRALARCAEGYALWSPSHPVEQALFVAVARMFVGYPARRWGRAASRVARRQPRRLPAFLALTPLIWLGAWAASTGLFAEFCLLRRVTRTGGANQRAAPGRS
jgi:hypothetical protein